jgi:hypothetical protein
MRPARTLLGSGLAMAVALGAAAAGARTRVCVQVRAPDGDAAPLRRLAISELNRHTTHQAVEAGCESVLGMELVAMGSERYLTGRLDDEVPHRETLAEGETAKAVERLLTVVLHNDPRRLHGPERDDWIGRTRAAFLRHGTTHFGLELYQTAALVGGELGALPSAALSARREVDRVHVGVRIGAASALDDARPALRLSQQFLAQLEIALYSSSETDTAWFGGFVGGLELQRYEGMVADGELGRRVASASAMGVSFGVRGGVELLRTSHVRFQLFAQFLTPTFAARDDQSSVVDQWTPTAALGVGVWL